MLSVNPGNANLNVNYVSCFHRMSVSLSTGNGKPACLLVDGRWLCSGVGGLVQFVLLSWADLSTCSGQVCSVPSRLEGSPWSHFRILLHRAPLAHSQFISESVHIAAALWSSCLSQVQVRLSLSLQRRRTNLISLSVEHLVYKLSKYLCRPEDNLSVIYLERSTFL